MKEGWEYKKLGEVCDRVSNIKWQNVPSDAVYSYVDLTAVDRDSLNITETQSINNENAPSRAKQIIKENDVLFGTTRPTLKRFCIVEDKNDGNICSTGFCVLRPNNKIVSSKWVFYQLMADKFYAYIEPLQSGAAYPAVTDGIVKSYIIPIPSLSEQQHIVEELDLLSSIIEKKKVQLNELDNLAQSLFYEMFGDPISNEKGWEKLKWSDALKIINGKNQKAVESVSGTYPIYGSGGIMGYATDFLCPKNTVIIGRKGNINKPILVHEPFWNVDTAFGLVSNEGIINHYYLYYFCVIFDFENLNKAVTIPSLTKKDLLEIEIPIPPFSLQRQFASKIEAIEHQKELIKQSIKEVETLFNSRMDYYFN